MKIRTGFISAVFTAVIFTFLTISGCGQKEPEAADSVGHTQATELRQDAKRQKGVYRYLQSNGYNFGKSKMQSTILLKGRSQEIPTIDAMADIYKGFDIIGLQEVSTLPHGSKAVGMLVDSLRRKGNDWSALISDITDKTSKSKEKYAVIFNKSKFEDIHGPQTGLMKSLTGHVTREPYHAVLREKSSGKLLHIYLFHLRPKNRQPKLEVEAVGMQSDLFERENVIISGDFNLPLKDLKGIFEGVLGLKGWINSKTSLKDKEVNREYLAFEYDNIFTGKGIEVMSKGIFDFMPIVGNVVEAHKISDHLFPWIEFKINGHAAKIIIRRCFLVNTYYEEFSPKRLKIYKIMAAIAITSTIAEIIHISWFCSSTQKEVSFLSRNMDTGETVLLIASVYIVIALCCSIWIELGKKSPHGTKITRKEVIIPRHHKGWGFYIILIASGKACFRC